VFAEIIRRGVEFELVFGGIEDVRGRAFGHLTLELRGDAVAVDEAVFAVSAMVETTEVA
jgi:D-methionine transport system ATP-binding protein